STYKKADILIITTLSAFDFRNSFFYVSKKLRKTGVSGSLLNHFSITENKPQVAGAIPNTPNPSNVKNTQRKCKNINLNIQSPTKLSHLKMPLNSVIYFLILYTQSF